MVVLTMKRIAYVITWLLLFGIWSLSLAASPGVRIKDIGHVLEARDNQLMGFGLVVGLRNTGDKSQTGFTQQALTNLLSRMGVVPQGIDYKSRNAAAVIVTATLPPFVKPGQKLDVTVSSVGDATSLQGGTLLITPLHGVDDQVYAVAQGSLLLGTDPNQPVVPYVRQQQVNAGRIPGGALVEKEIPVTIADKGIITIVLDEPDFTTASRVADAIMGSGVDATAKDAGTVVVPVAGGEDLVSLVAGIESLRVVPDEVAKIVVNERNGTVVIGENVKIAPVAVSYSGIDVVIGDISFFSDGSAIESQDNTRFHGQSNARLNQEQKQLMLLQPGASLASLVRALNTIGASPKDMVAILQAMKKAGAIKAEIEVI